MPSTYSYLDVAVLDPVRRRFAAGDALAILAPDLGQVLWANGPGAALFGFSDIDAIMAAGSVLPPVARRQLAATSGFPDIGRDRAVMLRLASGMASQAAGLLASAVVMPDGEKAILLAVPATGAEPSAVARRAVSGLSREEGEFFALLDARGTVEAASEGFDALGISGETLAALVEDVAGEADRLVKRRIAGSSGTYPAGLARLADEPARHLLVVVDDGGSAEAGPETAAAEPDGGVAAPQGPAPAAAGLPPPAAIDRNAAPVRFVWRTDAEGAFTTISPDFIAVVGERASAIVGRRFGEVAAAFGLDPSGEIAQLLERRDTWSGRTLPWPTESGLRVPVDLAALPVYSRERVFEGFRGFGVARPADAVSDPGAAALFAEPEERPATAPQETTPDAEPAGGTFPPADPFAGEVPALTIAPQPDRRFTDKVIRLAEHRPASADKGLSSGERSAFREIGERLKKDSAAAGQDADADQTAASAEPAAERGEAVAPLGPATEPGRLASGTIGAEPPPARSGSLLKYAATDTDAAGADDSIAAADFADARDDETLPSAAEMQAEGGAAEADGLPAGGAGDRANEERPARPGDEEETEVPRAVKTAPPLRRHGLVPSAFAMAQDRAPDTSILAKVPVPLLIHSGETLHYANDEFLDLTGYDTLEELTAAGGLDALFADPYADDSAADRTGRSLRLRARDGGELSVDALLRAVPWRGGKALMLVLRRAGGADGGETQERDAAAASRSLPGEPVQPDTAELKARIAEMRTIIDTATDGVVLIGRDGAIRSISRPAEALFGFDSDEVAGKPFASLFAIESQRAASDYLASLSEPGVASVLNDGREVIGREAQGRFIPLFMTVGRLPGDSGYCAVVRDITQWKRAEEDLTQARAVAERASSQKTDFLARISHEIRTPLNAIIGFSELMVDEKFGPIANDRYRDYLRDINRSGNHVLDLVNDLLDISKIEAGQQEMDYEAVSLNDTLAETVAMMQPQANRERVIIRSSLASRLPDVVADLRSVRQIALNILSNAIRYTQAGGQVIVSTAYEPSGDVVMRVRDTGVGMTQAEIEQALKPFKQLNALKRGRGDGTGLGLPLTKAMVEANRARFAIHSTPGEGTLVEVAFPSTRVLAE